MEIVVLSIGILITFLFGCFVGQEIEWRRANKIKKNEYPEPPAPELRSFAPRYKYEQEQIIQTIQAPLSRPPRS